MSRKSRPRKEESANRSSQLRRIQAWRCWATVHAAKWCSWCLAFVAIPTAVYRQWTTVTLRTMWTRWVQSSHRCVPVSHYNSAMKSSKPTVCKWIETHTAQGLLPASWHTTKTIWEESSSWIMVNSPTGPCCALRFNKGLSFQRTFVHKAISANQLTPKKKFCTTRWHSRRLLAKDITAQTVMPCPRGSVPSITHSLTNATWASSWVKPRQFQFQLQCQCQCLRLWLRFSHKFQTEETQ